MPFSKFILFGEKGKKVSH